MPNPLHLFEAQEDSAFDLITIAMHMLKAPHIIMNVPHIMTKVPHIMKKVQHITMKVQPTLMKAQHVKNIDHIRPSWLSIQLDLGLLLCASGCCLNVELQPF